MRASRPSRRIRRIDWPSGSYSATRCEEGDQRGSARFARRLSVTYLLDVNVLLALAYRIHVHSRRATRWLYETRLGSGVVECPRLATCAIVELGFIRIASGSTNLAENLNAARADLCRLKSNLGLILLPDDVEANRQPSWVTRPAQTTDGHLLELAAAHAARLVTLDGGISGAILIPDYPHGAPMIKDEPRYEDAA